MITFDLEAIHAYLWNEAFYVCLIKPGSRKGTKDFTIQSF